MEGEGDGGQGAFNGFTSIKVFRGLSLLLWTTERVICNLFRNGPIIPSIVVPYNAFRSHVSGQVLGSGNMNTGTFFYGPMDWMFLQEGDRGEQGN